MLAFLRSIKRPELVWGIPALLAAIVNLILSFPAFAAVTVSTGGAGGLLGLLVWLVVAGLIFWALWWFVGFCALPQPFDKIARVLIGLFALIFIVNLLLGLIGQPLFSLN